MVKRILSISATEVPCPRIGCDVRLILQVAQIDNEPAQEVYECPVDERHVPNDWQPRRMN